ncbi:MAG: hypothetical protein WDM84_07230 [Bauldia sp.]
MDPYAAPVSDAYQDLFGEGSFFGKGIYDVDADDGGAHAGEHHPQPRPVRGHLRARRPCRRRRGVEEFPRRYDVATSRQHRWARGDWQLLGWLFQPPASSGSPAAATLLGRWKMLDNLRRTLSAPVTVLALIAGWALPPAACLIWSAFVLIALAAPSVLPALLGVFSVAPKTTWRLHFSVFFGDLGLALAQTGFAIATLVHQAQLMLDAIVRTLWRLAVTRKRLLEWTTAEQASQRAEPDIAGYYRWMAVSVAVAALGAFVAFANTPATGLIALPFVLAWAAAPAIAERASRARQNAALAALTAEDARQLAPSRGTPGDISRPSSPPATTGCRPTIFRKPSRSRRRPPHLADQYRPLPALARVRLRFRLARPCRCDRAGRGDLRNAAEDVPVPRALLQLVRHAGPAAARSPVCFRRRQRQFRRSSHRAGQCLRGGHPRRASNTRAVAGIGDAVALVRQALVRRGPSPSPEVERRLAELESALRDCGDAADAPAASAQLDALAPRVKALVDAVRTGPPSPAGDGEDAVAIWVEAVVRTIDSHRRDVAAMPADAADRLVALAQSAREMALQMDFRFLMDPVRKLMSIGYLPPKAGRTPTSTTCSLPRRGWRASSPSPRATPRPSTGSSSAARRPRWTARRRWSRGRGRCSNT